MGHNSWTGRRRAWGGIVAAALVAASFVAAVPATAQGPGRYGLPGLGIPGAINNGPSMIGAGRPSAVAGNRGVPGQLNARSGQGSLRVGAGMAPQVRRSGGGAGRAGFVIPQTNQFRSGNMAERATNIPLPGGASRR